MPVDAPVVDIEASPNGRAAILVPFRQRLLVLRGRQLERLPAAGNDGVAWLTRDRVLALADADARRPTIAVVDVRRRRLIRRVRLPGAVVDGERIGRREAVLVRTAAGHEVLLLDASGRTVERIALPDVSAPPGTPAAAADAEPDLAVVGRRVLVVAATRPLLLDTGIGGGPLRTSDLDPSVVAGTAVVTLAAIPSSRSLLVQIERPQPPDDSCAGFVGVLPGGGIVADVASLTPRARITSDRLLRPVPGAVLEFDTRLAPGARLFELDGRVRWTREDARVGLPTVAGTRLVLHSSARRQQLISLKTGRVLNTRRDPGYIVFDSPPGELGASSGTACADAS